MGSVAKAKMVGFVCRLCSKIERVVIHLYSTRARKLDLLNKIKLLPITIDKYDNLPKTVCRSCITKLEIQWELVNKIRMAANIYKAQSSYTNSS